MIGRLLGKRRFMREHRWTHSHLSEYVDAELAVTERERLEAHVGICPQCHRVLATLRRTLGALRSLTVEPQPGLAPAVIDRLREERP